MLLVSAIFFILMMGWPNIKTQANGSVISGRVFAGSPPDEITSIRQVTVSLYCSGNHGVLGTMVDMTSTDVNGYYEFIVDDLCDYYAILEQDLPSFYSVASTSVGGVVIDDNWIEYTYPLEGKVLSGNKFWDDSSIYTNYIMQGKVFVGQYPLETEPIEGVTVSLFGGLNPLPDLGGLLASTTTNAEGWYGLGTVTPADFYRLVITVPPGFRSWYVSSVDGTVYSATIIDILVPAGHNPSTGNKFWLAHAVYLPGIFSMNP